MGKSKRFDHKRVQKKHTLKNKHTRKKKNKMKKKYSKKQRGGEIQTTLLITGVILTLIGGLTFGKSLVNSLTNPEPKSPPDHTPPPKTSSPKGIVPKGIIPK